MAISPAKVTEAAELCLDFLAKERVSHKYMEKLLGKVFHAIKCTPGGRRFTSRLLQLLSITAASPTLTAPVTHDARMDATWLAAFLPHFNGITLIKNEVAEFVVEVDSCLSGGGGVCEKLGYFKVAYPEHITTCAFSIASLECFNLLLSLRLWRLQWAGKHVLVFSDNWAVVCALQSGRASDRLIQGCIREMWWIAALMDIELTVRHKPGAELTRADALSRLHTTSTCNSRFHHIVNDIQLPEFTIDTTLLTPPLPI